MCVKPGFHMICNGQRHGRNGQERRTRFNFPDHYDRVADRCRSYGNQALGDGWQSRPCRHSKEKNQHAIDFVARCPTTKRLTAVFYVPHIWNLT